MKIIVALTLVVLLTTIQLISGKENSLTYSPINSITIEKPKYKTGTITGDYIQASKSKTLPEAMKNWENYLKKYDSGDFEDGFHANHVRLAKYELMRIYYILGRVEEADEIIKLLAKP